MLGRGSRVAGWLHSAPRLLRSQCAAALFSTPVQRQRIGTAATPAPPQGSLVFRPDAVKDQRRYMATAGAGRLNLLERKLAEKLQPMKIDDVDPEMKTALDEKYSPILGYPPNALLALARSRPVFHGAHALLSLTALGLARPEQSSSTSTGDSVSAVGTDTATAQQSEDPEVDPGLSERQVMACTYMAATLTESPYLKSQVEQMLSKVMEREQLDKMGMNCRLFWKEIEEFKESTVIPEHEKLLLELCISLFEGEVEPKVANRCVEELTEKVQAQVVHIGATMSFFATVSAILGLKPEVLFRGKSGAVDFDSQGAVDGKLAEAIQLGWRATFEPLSKAGQRAIDFHKTTDSAVAKKVRGGSKTSAESAASYQQRLNPAHQIRLAFGFVPNCLLSMYPTPELLYAGIRLFKCIFSEASTLPETLKLTVAVECARGLDNDYLESMLLFMAHNSGVPTSQVEKASFTSKSATIQAAFDLARAYGVQLSDPVYTTAVEIRKTRVDVKAALVQLRRFLTAEQIVEVVASLAYVSYLNRLTILHKPLPEPSVVVFKNSLCEKESTNDMQ